MMKWKFNAFYELSLLQMPILPQELFSKMDGNHDGRVSAEEFMTACTGDKELRNLLQVDTVVTVVTVCDSYDSRHSCDSCDSCGSCGSF